MPWDDPTELWDQGSWDNDEATPAGPFLSSETSINLSTITTMQYWEETKARAQATLTVWTQHAQTMRVGGKAPADLEALIGNFEPQAQTVAVKQDAADAKYRNKQSSLLKQKILGVSVPAIIEGQLDGDASFNKDLREVYRIYPRSETTILQRSRLLHPLWARADTAMAALTPTQPPIVKVIQNVEHTAALLKTMLDSYTDVTQELSNAQGELDTAQTALEKTDADTHALNVNWYQVAKASFTPGSAAYQALSLIPTEQGTPAPTVIDINTVLQGGDDGLDVLISYLAGGGAHATTKLLKWQVVGVDAGFDHSVPIDASGNAIGPFTVGQEIKIMTEVSNSSGTRTSAVRTIIMETPI